MFKLKSLSKCALNSLKTPIIALFPLLSADRIEFTSKKSLLLAFFDLTKDTFCKIFELSAFNNLGAPYLTKWEIKSKDNLSEFNKKEKK